MTRYARAKSSNERLPNDATPWHIMKQQLEDSKIKECFKREKLAQNSRRDEICTYNNMNGNIKYDWAKFDDVRLKSDIKKHNNSKLEKNHMKFTENFETPKNSKNNTIHTSIPKNSNKEKKLQNTKDIEIKKVNNKEKTFANKIKACEIDNLHLQLNKKESSISRANSNLNFVTCSKQQQNHKRKFEISDNKSKKFKKDVSAKSLNSKVKEKKNKEQQEYKRRKPNVPVTKMIINGVETEIVKYDGFPIRKEDAEKLAELKQEWIMKGLSKSYVDTAIKLERRRAEKALARVKKLVCFNCRMSGHLLSDCPKFDRDEASTGICFKCGSTEHTHFECKVRKDSSYRYAKCFVCHEQGHIAMQCPDNPKGIYPQGGCCKICSAVTHLKKDCPEFMKVKENNIITAEKMVDSIIEPLQKDEKIKDCNKRFKNKIVKF